MPEPGAGMAGPGRPPAKAWWAPEGITVSVSARRAPGPPLAAGGTGAIINALLSLKGTQGLLGPVQAVHACTAAVRDSGPYGPYKHPPA